MIVRPSGDAQRLIVGLARDGSAVGQVTPGVNRVCLTPLRAAGIAAADAIQRVVGKALRPRTIALVHDLVDVAVVTRRAGRKRTWSGVHSHTQMEVETLAKQGT